MNWPHHAAPAERRASRLLIPMLCILVSAAVAAAEPQEAPPPAGFSVLKPPDDAGPSPLDAEIRKLVKELRALMPRILESKRRLLIESPGLFALGMLKIEKADVCLGRPDKGEVISGRARDNLGEAVAVWSALLEGRRPELPERGLLERAYLARNDMSPQPYALYVPESYDGTESWGLLVFLHDAPPPVLDKVGWIKQVYRPALETLARQAKCVLLLPYGRGNAGFNGVGEDDVLRTIREVKRTYRIDEDRVFLSGIAAGATGVWRIGAHNPHLFAALIPIAGRGESCPWGAGKRNSLADWKAGLMDAEVGAEPVPNYMNLPVVIVHGGPDAGVPAQQGERMSALLAEQGADVTDVLVPDAAPGDSEKLLLAPEVLDCLKRKRREAEPLRVEFRTHGLQHPRAYWTEVSGIVDWDAPAQVACELSEAGDLLTVHTQNVSALRVRPPAAGRTPKSLPRVTWNGQTVTPKRAADGWLELRTEEAPADPLGKRTGLCGPIPDAFASPFALVPGDKSGPDFANAMQAAADWVAYAQGMPNIVDCAALSETLLARANLVLFGSPETNELIARVAPLLPIGLAGGRYRIGERTYDASLYALSMIYPNPLAPGRYVVINSGALPGWKLPPGDQYDVLPDFIIFRRDAKGSGTGSNRVVCAGFFDQHWRLSPASTWFAAEPAEPGQAPINETGEAASGG